MKKHLKPISRRHFLTGTAAALATVSIVPRRVLGAPEVSPSDTLGAALIGVGGRGPGTYSELTKSFQGVGMAVTKLAECDATRPSRSGDTTNYREILTEPA